MTAEQTFSDLGYGSGAVVFGARVRVVEVEFQSSLTDPSFPNCDSPRISDAVDQTARLLTVARAAGLPVVSCYTGYSGLRDPLYWKVKDVANWRLGTKGCELDPRIYDPDYDVVFSKTAPSIFFMTGAAPFLTKEGVDTVIVTGCTTSGCIRASVIDAFSFGFRVIVPEECCGDPVETTLRANLEDVGRLYCDVMRLEDVLGHLDRPKAAAE